MEFMVIERTGKYLAVYNRITDSRFLKSLLADPGCLYVDEPFTTYPQTLIAMFESPPHSGTAMPITHQIVEVIKSGGNPNGCMEFWMNIDVKEYSSRPRRVEKNTLVDWIKERKEISEAYGFDEALNIRLRGSCASPDKVRIFEKEIKRFMKPSRVEAIALYGRHRRAEASVIEM